MATIYNAQLDAFELHHKIQELDGSSHLSGSSTALLRAVQGGLSGATGSAISNVATYPLDLIITRLQIQRQLRRKANEASDAEYHGLIDAAQKIIQQDGWTGLYTGLLSDTGKTVLESFMFFLTYDFMRRRRLRSHGSAVKGLPAMEELGVGYLAATLTKLCTTPVAMLVTRKQAAALTQSNPSLMEIAQRIMEEKGLGGFWSGYSASVILNIKPSFTFFLFETFKKILLPRSQREEPSALATFFLAATSKACATAVTYPFSLAKSRLQAGDMKKEDADEKKVVEKEAPASAGPNTKKAARTTIFSTLLTIAHNEGVSALYEGVHLEILKAFLGHGITMLVKQLIQRFMTKVYYTLSVIWSSWAGKADITRVRLAEKAKQSGHEYYDLAIRRTSERMEQYKKEVDERAKEAAAKAKDAADFVADYVDEDAEGLLDMSGVAGIAKWLDGRKPDS